MTHLPDGPVLNPSVAGPYGPTSIGFVTLAHGSAWDTLELSLTVQAPVGTAGSLWGDFTGSWHAIHRGPTAAPDAAATMSLLLLGLSVVGVLRSRLHRA